MLLSKPLTIICAGVLIAYNITSVGLAYRAGQQSVLREQFETLANELNNAVGKYGEQLSAYEHLAVEFAANHEATQKQMKKTEDTLNAYLATIDRSRPCLDDTGVSLLNKAIRPGGNSARKNSPTASGGKRATPVPRPAATK